MALDYTIIMAGQSRDRLTVSHLRCAIDEQNCSSDLITLLVL